MAKAMVLKPNQLRRKSLLRRLKRAWRNEGCKTLFA